MSSGLSQLQWIAIATMALLLVAAFLYASFTGTVDDVLNDLNATSEKTEEDAGSFLENPLQGSGGEGSGDGSGGDTDSGGG